MRTDPIRLLLALVVLAVLPGSAAAQASETYTVRAGDTLYRIAVNHGLSVEEMMELNELDSSAIRIGQELIVSDRLDSESEAEADPAAPRDPSPEPVPETAKASETDPASDSTAEFGPDSTAAGPVAVFPETYAGRAMAGGEPYDPNDLVVSHPDLPMGTVLLLEHRDASAEIEVRVADRGPLDDHLLLDVSRAVAEELRLEDGDVVHVRVAE